LHSSVKEIFLEALNQKIQKGIELSHRVRNQKLIVYGFLTKFQELNTEIERKKQEINKKKMNIEKLINKKMAQIRRNSLEMIFEVLHGCIVSNLSNFEYRSYYFVVNLDKLPLNLFFFLSKDEEEEKISIKFDFIGSMGVSNFFQNVLITAMKFLVESGKFYENINDFIKDVSFCIKSVSVFVSYLKKFGDYYCFLLRLCSQEGSSKIEIEGNLLHERPEKFKISFYPFEWFYEKLTFECRSLQWQITFKEMADIFEEMHSNSFLE